MARAANTTQSHHRRAACWLALALLLAAAIVAGQPVRPAAAQGLLPTATPTPAADARPDACEPNADQAHACRIAVDAVSGPFTFLPEGDVDVYSVFLGDAPNGLETTITLRATSGLDLYTTVRKAEGGAPLATIASPTISTTLAADVAGWVVLRVENRGAAIAMGQSYRIEVRRTLPPATTTTPTASGPEGLTRATDAPDALENNWSPETAAPIAVGVLYDLNFVCPIADGCPGGDHDHLRFEVKAGGRYLISAFDLADGVDTVIDLFWWNADTGWQLLTSNDDDRAGAAFLSTIRWQAPGDGVALIRVGPRSGGLNPILGGTPSYRLAIALAGSPLAAQLEARIAAQTNAPTPTAAPTVAAPPASGGDPGASAAPVAPTAVPVTDDATSGAAIVVAETPAYTAPDAASPTLGTIPVDTLIQLTGRVAGLWVEVETPAIVGAAWVDRRVLRPAPPPDPAETLTAAGADPRIPTPAGALPAPAAATALAAAHPADPAAAITPVADMPPPTATAAVPAPAHIEVTLLQGAQPLPGMRVILLSALDAILGQQVTDDAGLAVFDLAVPAGTRLDVAIPALGLRVPIDPASPSITVTLPTEED